MSWTRQKVQIAQALYDDKPNSMPTSAAPQARLPGAAYRYQGDVVTAR